MTNLSKMSSMMQLKKIITKDGSPSLFNPHLDEPYHSRLGALSESQHVYVQNGLKAAYTKFGHVDLLEMGIGTGLNVLLSLNHLIESDYLLDYTGIELFPINAAHQQELELEKYASNTKVKEAFQSFLDTPYGRRTSFSEQFSHLKIQENLLTMELPQEAFNLVYFDAFGPPTQPDLWTVALFQKLYGAMQPGGMLVTYCAKGQVRRNMITAGFEVERLPGPPRKKEMLRANKS